MGMNLPPIESLIEIQSQLDHLSGENARESCANLALPLNSGEFPSGKNLLKLELSDLGLSVRPDPLGIRPSRER
jgi:hypothetical protein